MITLDLSGDSEQVAEEMAGDRPVRLAVQYISRLQYVCGGKGEQEEVRR